MSTNVEVLSIAETPFVGTLFGPNEAFKNTVQQLSTSYELEVQPWLLAGEETLLRIDQLFT